VSLPREDLPEFLRALSAYDGAAGTRLALRLAVLTFVRTTELRPRAGTKSTLKLPNGASLPNA
jgi:hypothetical protein